MNILVLGILAFMVAGRALGRRGTAVKVAFARLLVGGGLSSSAE
jgi:hypothetical protein